MKIELNNTAMTSAWFDLTPYISNTGLRQEEEDIDAAGSGRTQDGVMQRSRVAEKEKWNIVTIPISGPVKRAIKAQIRPQFVSVRITEYGTKPYIITAYAGNRSTDFVIKKHGKELWKLSFALIER